MKTTIEHAKTLKDSKGENVIAHVVWSDEDENYYYLIVWESGDSESGLATSADPWDSVYDILRIEGERS